MRKSKATPVNEPPHKSARSGNIFDVFVKQMFGRIFVFADFLRRYADQDFVREIDLKRIRLAPTHYIGKKGDERIVDLVFTCPLKNGKGNLTAVIIFEHQGGSLRKIPRKLLKYIAAIWTAEEKEGRKPSAPFFIVLRTAKKPHRGRYPTLADGLPKDKDGNPIGKTVEIAYDVVDLPAWDFDKLIGGPVVRLALGILKATAEDMEEELPEALSPLREISDEEQKFELTKEVLEFFAKWLAAHNKRLDEAELDKALKPVLRNEEMEMIKTIFDEKFDEGVAVGEARGLAQAETKALAEKSETILTFLRARFKRVPKDVAQTVRQAKDKTVLDSWAAHAATCESMAEFERALDSQ